MHILPLQQEAGKRNCMKNKDTVRKHSEVRVHIKKDMFLQNSLVIENFRISRWKLRSKRYIFVILVSESHKIIHQIMCHNVLTWPVFLFYLDLTISCSLLSDFNWFTLLQHWKCFNSYWNLGCQIMLGLANGAPSNNLGIKVSILVSWEFEHQFRENKFISLFLLIWIT